MGGVNARQRRHAGGGLGGGRGSGKNNWQARYKGYRRRCGKRRSWTPDVDFVALVRIAVPLCVVACVVVHLL